MAGLVERRASDLVGALDTQSRGCPTERIACGDLWEPPVVDADSRQVASVAENVGEPV
ncbi:hypothetical protein JCM4814A_82430 [Streptomyces phaeofaciens JCM 4814]|uniref:Uncharacterized protein n=1 Tax=Streptomyces phaeofaciens TaxID=68254 RepID=A0A918HPK6_9ACTN|nr:hypothetical protein GCM10010226_80430 [Streptomyces phaeofaciens]